MQASIASAETGRRGRWFLVRQSTVRFGQSPYKALRSSVRLPPSAVPIKRRNRAQQEDRSGRRGHRHDPRARGWGGSFLTSASAITTGKTIRLEEGPGQETHLDLGKRGRSQGDEDIFSGKLKDVRTGKRAGETNGRCVLTDPDGDEQVCVEVFKLEGGSIIVEGSNAIGEEGEKEDNVSAVTGGTGRYQNVRGEVTEGGKGHEEEIVIHLIP